MKYSIKSAKKVYRKVKQPVKTVAKTYLNYRRGKYAKKLFKGGQVSTVQIAKTLSNLKRDTSAGLEWKTLDQAHTTVGNPDVALRYFWRIAASANLATQSNTTTLGTVGYLLREISLPAKGDDSNQYDGQKFLVKSIQMKGSCALLATGDQTVANGTLRLMIVKFTDSVDSTFDITELLNTDNNGEYSTQSRRNRDKWNDCRVICSRNIKLSYGSKTKTDFNMLCYPNQIHRHFDTGSTQHNVRYYAVAIASPDISSHLTQFDLNYFTRMRFVH